ncbi:ABC transporter ATP-binding protein [Microbacterium sp. BWT-B31]|uniref:ABC transporter ATP-binding protein n=1 Tax=Microbacterium sp. BWT-B31 TaxID=3232072 RepID=UPI003526E800
MSDMAEVGWSTGVRTSGSPILSVRGVSLGFGGISALTDVSFDLPKGAITGLIGPNGAGKTSLFNCVTGFYKPSAGEISLDGTSLVERRPDEIASLGITRTFQNLGLVEGLSVLENLLLGGYHRGRGGVVETILGLPRPRREERALHDEARELLHMLELEPFADQLAKGLPFGTMKRIELAKALMAQGRVLLLDEPANGLIHGEVVAFGELIQRIVRERDLSVLLVEHHMGLVMSTCSSVVVLDHGQVIAVGSPDEVQNNPAVIEAYLGAGARR